VRPRIRLGRSFDQRSRTYLGYVLRVRGSIGGEVREFLVGVGEGAHAKHRFRAGDTVSGDALPVADPRLETVEFCKVSDLRVTASFDLSRTRSSAACGETVRRKMHELHVGLPHGSRNDC
jgi:hypothetical protein